MTSDVLLAKLASIDRCLQRIRTVTRGNPAAVRDIDVQEIVLLNLQRAIQAVIDLSAHLITSKGWGLPDSQRQHIAMLEQNKVVSPQLADRLRAMVGFRNIAVHEYHTSTQIFEVTKGGAQPRPVSASEEDKARPRAIPDSMWSGAP